MAPAATGAPPEDAGSQSGPENTTATTVVAGAGQADAVKSPEELRAERLEKFGSYTAYSLWRKIPAMAAGIIQPKPDSYYERHGLREYWKNERDHFQGRIEAMSEAERAAKGVRLLDD